MKNAVSGRATTVLSSLYDELESKIRALESLGRTQEKYGDFLSPLVESYLPEEILIAWERFRNLNEATDGKRSLEQLLSFLNKEVRGKQLIELALSGFASGSPRKRDTWPKSVPDYGTASMLVSTSARDSPAPLKQVTIPRLELMASCIGARLAHSVQRALNITDIETIFWSDFMVTLFWLRDKGDWSVFVANRIKEIKLLFPKRDWRHIPGNMNPADLIFRGCSPNKLIESRWWEGPSWLLEPSHTWPVNELINCETSEILLERRKVRLCNLNLSEKEVPWYAKKFSKFNSIIRLVAWILRFINKFKNSHEKRNLEKI
ncbi:integrase catalytic domain-containing protein [Trichonephila inaurata madagascariensis]|uniref:Integrase catalytic domain-containing protein n=1 Tax=Trichonephila inaurata madagascariensis TaxID=2747483 RepID=A0A8X7CGM8_9ARAC|nr:integrase catalytic domain-containing protein [Trichonephila inaurata madagascariensis]